MHLTEAGLLAGAMALVLLAAVPTINAAEVGVCSIVAKPANFDHQTVTVQGTATTLKETTSRKGNDYTTFKLQDPSGCGAYHGWPLRTSLPATQSPGS
jgi:hypothetical protein